MRRGWVAGIPHRPVSGSPHGNNTPALHQQSKRAGLQRQKKKELPTARARGPEPCVRQQASQRSSDSNISGHKRKVSMKVVVNYKVANLRCSMSHPAVRKQAEMSSPARLEGDALDDELMDDLTDINDHMERDTSGWLQQRNPQH